MSDDVDFMSDDFLGGATCKQEDIEIGRKEESSSGTTNPALRSLRRQLRQAKRERNWKRVSYLKKQIRLFNNKLKELESEKKYSENKVSEPGNVGLQILKTMGFEEGDGLGAPDSGGMKEPLDLDIRRNHPSTRRVGIGGFENHSSKSSEYSEKLEKVVNVEDFRKRMQTKYENSDVEGPLYSDMY